MSDGELFKLDVFFGHCEMQKREVWSADGRTCEFQGRSIHYDRSGEVVEVTPWQTSARMFVPVEESRPWWRF